MTLSQFCLTYGLPSWLKSSPHLDLAVHIIAYETKSILCMTVVFPCVTVGLPLIVSGIEFGAMLFGAKYSGL